MGRRPPLSRPHGLNFFSSFSEMAFERDQSNLSSEPDNASAMEDHDMPTQTAIIIAAIALPFIIFAVTLGWVDYWSRGRRS